MHGNPGTVNDRVSPSASSRWPWIIAAVLVVLVAITYLFVRGRREQAR
jgi:hypothetical protein